MKFWNEQKSIVLTKYLVRVLALAAAVCTVRGPQIVRWLIRERTLSLSGPAVEPVLLALGYCCAALAFWMLFNLDRFLRQLEAGAVFVPQTVTALRRVSWCCAAAALLCLPTGAIVYLPFVFLGVAAGFTALLVRVIKNVFEQAVRMKRELDLTI